MANRTKNVDGRVRIEGAQAARPKAPHNHELAESREASQQTIMSIAGHVLVEMLRYYLHILRNARRNWVAVLDNDPITSQLGE